MIEERESLATALIEREQDIDEHNLVIKTLEGQDGSKKAWRLVGDVMVERTVAGLLPDVIKQKDNLSTLSQSLRKQLEAKRQEVIDFQEKYNISFKGDQQSNKKPASMKESAQQGVLVSSC